jgi:hypothetical protein
MTRKTIFVGDLTEKPEADHRCPTGEAGVYVPIGYCA